MLYTFFRGTFRQNIDKIPIIWYNLQSNYYYFEEGYNTMTGGGLMDDAPMLFIKAWNDKDSKGVNVHLRPETQGKSLYGVDFRFSGRSFSLDEKTFEKLCNRIYTNSKNLMQVTTSADDFRSGIMYVAVLFCNHGYNPKIVTKTLDFILNKVFPSLTI